MFRVIQIDRPPCFWDSVTDLISFNFRRAILIKGQRTIKDDHQILKISASLSDKLATPTRSRDAGSYKVFHSTGDHYHDNNDDIFDDDKDDHDDGDDDDDDDDDDDGDGDDNDDADNACTVLFFPGHPVNGSQA